MGIMHAILASFEIFANPNGDLVDHTGPLDDGLKDALESGNTYFITMMYATKFFFLMAAGEFEMGLKLLNARIKVCPLMDGSICESFFVLLDGLFSFGSARKATTMIGRKTLIKRGKKAMKVLQKFAIQNPANCMTKAILLEAEYAALCKKDSLAKQKYSQAIAVGMGTNTFFEVAFSNQLAAIHYCVDLDDPRTAVAYMEAAIKAYIDWGGHAAVTVMERKLREIRDSRRFSIQDNLSK
jgi:hypothetical protein